MSESSSGAHPLEHDRSHALLQTEDFAGAAELRADPLPRQHLTGRNDDRLLIVRIDVGLNRIADDHDGAILQVRGRRPFHRIDVGHRDAALARTPLRAELPQFVDELSAECVARTEAAHLGVGLRPRIDPILEALEFVEVGARRRARRAASPTPRWPQQSPGRSNRDDGCRASGHAEAVRRRRRRYRA